MNAVFIILTVAIVIASVLLVIVVLLQNGKGDGMASNFVAANQVLGVRHLVTFVLVVSIVTSFTLGNGRATMDVTDELDVTTTEQPAFPSSPIQEVPSTEAPATEAPATEAPAE